MSQQALVIDDDGRNLDVLAHLLRREGLEVISVANPAVELEMVLATAQNIAVAFVDIELPHTNGYDILRRLKLDGRFQNIPIAAYTVHVSEMDVAYEQGFHSFLSKPLDAQKFPFQLAQILRGQPVWTRN
jgi:CheY-like chemotaxis protein